MAVFGTWIKRTVQQVLDPDREQRTQEYAKLLLAALQKRREQFSLDAFAKEVNISKQDLDAARSHVYCDLLDRAWKDGKVTGEEKAILSRAAERLQIPLPETRTIQLTVARDRFAASLAAAMDDGVIEDREAARLQEIAAAVDCSLSEFVSRYFLSEGESFLRGVFAACTYGGTLADDAWERLVASTSKLGLSRQALSTAILPQSHRFIEHVLADAKSDGELSEEEEKHLTSLVQKLNLPPNSRSYLDESIAALRLIRQVRAGNLPSINRPVGIAVRAGEIVHLHTPATWMQRRILKSGDKWEEHVGSLTVTDNRLIFTSNTKSYDVRFAKIAGHSGKTGQIRLQRMEKPESAILVIEDEPISYAILEGAIALALQTRLAKQGGKPDRHIPREVRQRVWQRYGGACAECGDGQYLEFDHVIPVAKGGSNSDANVQLLCRKCNLKKSDFI
jgi:hypothetical protein